MRKKITLVLFGVCLIAGAVLYFLNDLNVITISFSAWWTFFLIVPALADMLTRKVQVWNTILLVLGLWFFIREQPWEWLDERLLDVLAVTLAVIALGILLIVRGVRGNKETTPSPLPGAPGYDSQHNPRTDSLPRPNYSAVFSGGEYRSLCPALQNVQANGIFGGVDVDLTNAGFCHGTIINVTAFFGGVTIRLPQNVNVHFEGSSPFGGIDNHTSGNFNPNLPTVCVKYFALFGGVVFRY
ncbi:MAG: cell wall-active antibiotics response protein [Oscillospiraceae bacterium]|jgi:predicted membrane protein|nr:cell wall-active antibiotics response protein [Oscillospiraceae bacterium]